MNLLEILTKTVEAVPQVKAHLSERTLEILARKYSPDQPRDDIGRWTEGNNKPKEENDAINKINNIAERMGINKSDIVYGSMPDGTDSFGAYRVRDGKIFIDIKRILNIGVDPVSVFAHEAEHKYYYEVFKKELFTQNEAINKLAESGDYHFEDGLLKDEYINWAHENYPAIKASSIINNAINSGIKLTPYADKFITEYPERYITENMSEVARLLSIGTKVPDVWLNAYYSYRGIK